MSLLQEWGLPHSLPGKPGSYMRFVQIPGRINNVSPVGAVAVRHYQSNARLTATLRPGRL